VTGADVTRSGSRSPQAENNAKPANSPELSTTLPRRGAAGRSRPFQADQRHLGHLAAAPIAERIRVRIASAAEVRLSASIGIAAHPEHGDTITKLLTVADKALYKAKRADPDRAVTGEPGVR
jgi:GGDEF domain-containing protein